VFSKVANVLNIRASLENAKVAITVIKFGMMREINCFLFLLFIIIIYIFYYFIIIIILLYYYYRQAMLAWAHTNERSEIFFCIFSIVNSFFYCFCTGFFLP
jgi:hypothetical protein